MNDSTAARAEPLGAEERAGLLRLARAAIAEPLGQPGAIAAARSALPETPRLFKPCGLFVTLRLPSAPDGAPPALRGCIGDMEPSAPLWCQVLELAPRAAFSDPRFPPVQPAEFDRLRIGLSVLSPGEEVEDPATLAPGLDGVEIERDGRRAVFLPHVASEHGWDRERLLEQLCAKAGLPAGAWRDARLCRFRDESFSESL